jgi:hypothetical protein
MSKRDPRTSSDRAPLGRWTDDTERDEYSDTASGYRNMGRIRPNQAEWGDYIQEAQTDYLSGIASGEIELPKVTTKDARKAGFSGLGNVSGERRAHMSEQFGE